MVFGSDRDRPLNLWILSLDGTGKPERLTTSVSEQSATSISSDGRLLAFPDFNSETTGYDLMVMPLDGERQPREWLKTRFNESGARFSPDDRYLAYVSDETGRSEVYVEPYRETAESSRYRSTGAPRRCGRRMAAEIFFRNGNAVLSADISLTPRTPRIGVGFSRVLFTGNCAPATLDSPVYDMTPDGNAFIMVQPYEENVVS